MKKLFIIILLFVFVISCTGVFAWNENSSGYPHSFDPGSPSGGNTSTTSHGTDSGSGTETGGNHPSGGSGGSPDISREEAQRGLAEAKRQLAELEKQTNPDSVSLKNTKADIQYYQSQLDMWNSPAGGDLLFGIVQICKFLPIHSLGDIRLDV